MARIIVRVITLTKRDVLPRAVSASKADLVQGAGVPEPHKWILIVYGLVVPSEEPGDVAIIGLAEAICRKLFEEVPSGGELQTIRQE